MIRITYADGRTDDIRLTMLDQAKAEEHAQQHDWGAIDVSGVRRGLYSCYWHLRHVKRVSDTFEQWMETVTNMQTIEEEPGKSATTAPTEMTAGAAGAAMTSSDGSTTGSAN